MRSDRVPEELWMAVCDIAQDHQDHPQEKCKKGKWLSEEGLKIGEKRRQAKVKREKERYTNLTSKE